jgi:hypothetical protein
LAGQHGLQLQRPHLPGQVLPAPRSCRCPRRNAIVNGSLKPLPPNGVIYVEKDPSATCSVYDPTDTEAVQPGCGDALVDGLYSDDLTIAAEADVIVTRNIVRAGDTTLGLIANNFVRVAHRVTGRSVSWDGSSYDWNCSNSGGTPGQIDAAILTLNHSFIVDNWYWSNQLGALTVNGAIAQKYGGIVGTFGNQDTGYRTTEQTPAR